MTLLLINKIKSLFRDESGVTLVEYGLAIALAIAIGGGTLVLLGGEISNALLAVGTQMPN